MENRKRIHLVAAARPNFMKIAPLFHALCRESWCDVSVVHTGQHYDPEMSDLFFQDLGLPKPEYNLGIGSGTHAEQTAGVMVAYERVCAERRPDWVVVAGDVNSTAACAMVCAKLWIPVIHLEAGLRSRDRRMPEEINRLVTDAIADVLWTPSQDADENLLAEGVPVERIECIGNIMIDSYEMLKPKIEADTSWSSFAVEPGRYGVVTLHRPANVDPPQVLTELVRQLAAISSQVPLVFPVHPRTQKRLQQTGLDEALARCRDIHVTAPLSYVPFMGLVTRAKFVLTDSGGIQEETTYLGIPCITVRDTTERPITTRVGTNRLAGAAEVEQLVRDVLAGAWPHGERIPGWDGRAAQRASAHLRRLLGTACVSAAA